MPRQHAACDPDPLDRHWRAAADQAAGARTDPAMSTAPARSGPARASTPRRCSRPQSAGQVAHQREQAGLHPLRGRLQPGPGPVVLDRGFDRPQTPLLQVGTDRGTGTAQRVAGNGECRGEAARPPRQALVELRLLRLHRQMRRCLDSDLSLRGPGGRPSSSAGSRPAHAGRHGRWPATPAGRHAPPGHARWPRATGFAAAWCRRQTRPPG